MAVSTLDLSPPPEETAVVTATVEPEETEVVTETAVAPPEATAEITDTAAPTLSPEPTGTPEATTTAVLIPIVGLARYQSHLPDNAGINVTILDSGGNIISTAVTDSKGLYTVSVPPEGLIQVRFEAAMHRRVTGLVPSSAVPSEVILAGGDLNQDGCIGPTDITLLTAHFETNDSADTDINGDGLTETADLAILAGNYESDCEQLTTPTATPTAESTAETTPAITLEVTAETTPSPTAETQAATLPPAPTLPIAEPSPEPGATATLDPETTSSTGG